MRTTVTINDELLSEVKLRAARSHATIGEILEDALRAYLAGDAGRETPAALPDFGYRGGITIDLYDKDELNAVLDDAVS